MIERLMDCKRSYFESLDAEDGTRANWHAVLALLGASARIRQLVTGRRPTRQEWIADLDVFIVENMPILKAASEEMDKFFPLDSQRRPQLRSTKNAVFLKFAAHWLSDAPREFQCDRARALIAKLPKDIEARLKRNTPGARAAKALATGILENLKDEPTPWADGMHLFGWPAIRSGFQAFEPVPKNDPRGLYMLVRESRDWSTATPSAPIKLVRDLFWIRSKPGHDHDSDHGATSEFKGVGRYYSAFNNVMYRLNHGVQAGDAWHRFSGPPVDAEPNEQRGLEIVCPSLQKVTGNRPAFALMIAHTKDGNVPGVWKAVILRIDRENAGWEDIDDIEPDLEMFCDSAEPKDTDVRALMEYLRSRGLIGEFLAKEEENIAEVHHTFRALLLGTHHNDHIARLRAKVSSILEHPADGAEPSAQPDPVEALISNWAAIEPSQFILPSPDDIFVHADQANWAIRRLFSRDSVSEDAVEPKLAELRAAASALAVSIAEAEAAQQAAQADADAKTRTTGETS